MKYIENGRVLASVRVEYQDSLEDSMHGDKRSGIISRVSYYWEGSSTTAWIPLNRLCSRYSSEIRLFSPTQIRCVTVDPLVLLPFEDDFPLELILLCLCLFHQICKRRKNTKKRRSEVRKILFRKKFAVNKNFYSFISFRYFLKRLDNLPKFDGNRFTRRRGREREKKASNSRPVKSILKTTRNGRQGRASGNVRLMSAVVHTQSILEPNICRPLSISPTDELTFSPSFLDLLHHLKGSV